MNQVPMRGMNLNYLEASFTSATRRLGEGCDDPLNAFAGDGPGHRIAIGKSHRARSYDILPSTFDFRNHAMTFHGR